MQKVDDYMSALIQVQELQKNSIKCGEIKNHVFSYNSNTPIYDIRIEPDTSALYVVPRAGDILINITVEGTFSKCTLYQYDFFDRKIVYDTIDNPKKRVMNPFKEGGFPLIQLGKNLYIEIEDKQDDVVVYGTFGGLDSFTRKLLANYVSDELQEYGCKVKHKDGRLFVVHAINDLGFSPNYLGPEMPHEKSNKWIMA